METPGNWMSSNRLSLNASKMQFIWLGNGHQLKNIDPQAISADFHCLLNIYPAILGFFFTRKLPSVKPKSYIPCFSSGVFYVAIAGPLS